MTHPALWWTLMILRMIALRYFINQAKLVSTLHSLASVQRRDLTASEMSAGKWMLIVLDRAPVAQTLDSAIHPIKVTETNCVSHKLEISPVDRAIHWINLYLGNDSIGFPGTYSLVRDLSSV